MTGWQTPERTLTRALKQLHIDATITFDSWIVKRESNNVYRVWFKGVSASVARFASQHGGSKLVARIVRFILDSVVQRALLPGMPEILIELAQIAAAGRRVARAIHRIVTGFHKKPKPAHTVNIDDLPLFAWRPPACQRVA